MVQSWSAGQTNEDCMQEYELHSSNTVFDGNKILIPKVTETPSTETCMNFPCTHQQRCLIQTSIWKKNSDSKTPLLKQWRF
jgi:hypothetical protein